MKRSKKKGSSSEEEGEDSPVRQAVQGSVFMNQGQSIEFMMVTPDEKLYTCEADGCVRVYDLDTGELDSQSKPVQARSVQLEPQAIFINTRNNTVIAWSTTKTINDYTIEDDILYTASMDGTVMAWDTSMEQAKTKNLSKFFGDSASRQAAPGVRTAAVYMGRTKNGPEVELTKKHRNVFKGHKEAITSLFYDNGIMYTASTDLTIKSWNPKLGKCLKTFKGHTAWVYCCRTYNGLLYSSSRDKTVRVWNPKKGECIQVMNVETSLTSFKIKGNHLFGINSEKAGLADDSLKMISLQSGKFVNVFEGHSARIRVFKMYGDRLFTASADGTIREWSIKLGQCMNVLRGHEGSVNAISFKGGTLYSAGDDGTIRVWEYSDADPDNPLSEELEAEDSVPQRRNTVSGAAPFGKKAESAPSLSPLGKLAGNTIGQRTFSVALRGMRNSSSSSATCRALNNGNEYPA
ncbi:WD40 repeat-containing protein [Acanthamoeba castellanii str. Neff]|uniref:WD40 repeat-containing protein n=1 Tax=Acanthamoeba castellanii (strain ATCC 30010 / Neff) TaxID=1257118 RepID=L8GKD5_ACACF|nr:WD40 repeat-containing protein [Acanthamoeba castellanii str. Neff]ELR13304.1 WD40 repeat-containing protein [Acanthamoeba castellanii str. Neff]